MRGRALVGAILGLCWGSIQELRGDATLGVVVAGEPEACQAGLDLLQRGGNAVDAAVGAALVLAVVHPEAGNLGGGGFAVVLRGREVAALDFRETAPARAHPDLFRNVPSGEDAGSDPSRTGGLAVAVPGSPAGYFELHRRFGRLPWSRVVEPARKLAEQGFELGLRTARQLALERDRLERFPNARSQWLPGGFPLGAGVRIQLPRLAEALRRYQTEGPRAFSEGPLAEAIVRVVQAAGGVLSHEDLAAYRPRWREPIAFEIEGWQLYSMPLPSSGGYLAAAMAAMLRARGFRELPRASVLRAHLFAEAARRAYRDRTDFGDREEIDLAALLRPERLEALAQSIRADRATSSAELVASSQPTREGTETTHISVLDRDGNAVALTTTINEIFGSAVWIPEVEIFLNNEMDDFATRPGQPNAFGLIQGKANEVAPGRRPLSSMTPIVGVRGSERLAIGGRGGSRIPTGVLQVLFAYLEGDTPLGAVTRPRLHHQFLPDQLDFEPGALSRADRRWLEEAGHRLVETGTAARVSLAVRSADGSFACGPDPRGPEQCALR